MILKVQTDSLSFLLHQYDRVKDLRHDKTEDSQELGQQEKIKWYRLFPYAYSLENLIEIFIIFKKSLPAKLDG